MVLNSARTSTCRKKSSQHKFQFRDDLSYSRGRHTVRGGVDFLYEPQWGGYFENNSTPEFDFYASPSQLLALPQGFSTPGAVQFMTGTSGDPSFNLSPKMLGLYLEDDWRARSACSSMWVCAMTAISIPTALTSSATVAASRN